MINTNNGSAPDQSQENQGKKAPITKLPRMEMYAVLGLELAKKNLELDEKIFEKLQEVEESMEILARQKARELDPERTIDVWIRRRRQPELPDKQCAGAEFCREFRQ
jgi:hypothetical protein